METALARLRAKTDRELCILIARELHNARRQAGRGASQDAAKSYLEAMALLSVAVIPPAERARFERTLQELRRTIELPFTAVA